MRLRNEAIWTRSNSENRVEETFGHLDDGQTPRTRDQAIRQMMSLFPVLVPKSVRKASQTSGELLIKGDCNKSMPKSHVTVRYNFAVYQSLHQPGTRWANCRIPKLCWLSGHKLNVVLGRFKNRNNGTVVDKAAYWSVSNTGVIVTGSQWTADLSKVGTKRTINNRARGWSS